MTAPKQISIIGAGPAGLMAAEIIAAAGHAVTVYERKPSPGRKFLMAGRGGLNLTHSEPLETFLTRYGSTATRLEPAIRAFPPEALRAWCENLNEPTFIGTSGRVFPKSMKASPLLRAWLARLESLKVRFAFGHEWLDWDGPDHLTFRLADGTTERARTDATLLALGGASWPRLGSDGGWAGILTRNGVTVTPLKPSNCGFTVAWSDMFKEKFAGQPLKPVILSFNGTAIRGEAMVSRNGIEGGAVYALSAALRDAIAANGHAILTLDVRPGVSQTELAANLAKPRGRNSFANVLRKGAGLSPLAIGLLRESVGANEIPKLPPDQLAARIKALPLRLDAPFPIDRAISSAGGIPFDELDNHFMIRSLPGVFAAGEMLDWEAPTGGYLLQASFSTAAAAAHGILAWIR